MDASEAELSVYEPPSRTLNGHKNVPRVPVVKMQGIECKSDSKCNTTQIEADRLANRRIYGDNRPARERYVCVCVQLIKTSSIRSDDRMHSGARHPRTSGQVTLVQCASSSLVGRISSTTSAAVGSAVDTR